MGTLEAGPLDYLLLCRAGNRDSEAGGRGYRGRLDCRLAAHCNLGSGGSSLGRFGMGHLEGRLDFPGMLDLEGRGLGNFEEGHWDCSSIEKYIIQQSKWNQRGCQVKILKSVLLYLLLI